MVTVQFRRKTQSQNSRAHASSTLRASTG